MEIQKVQPEKPDIRITMTWDEAVFLCSELSKSFYANALYHDLYKALGLRGVDGDSE